MTFTGITKEQLFFAKEDADLRIVVAAKEAEEGVIIKDYYASSPDRKIEAIEVEGHQLISKGVDQLVAAMSDFTSLDKVSLWQSDEAVLRSIHCEWINVPPSQPSIASI